MLISRPLVQFRRTGGVSPLILRSIRGLTPPARQRLTPPARQRLTPPARQRLTPPARQRLTSPARWRLPIKNQESNIKNLRRRGFTLLEMLLATLISLLLMGAVYVAINVQLRHAQAGRDVIEQSALAHNLLARISSDIKKCVTAVAPTPPPPLSTLPTDGSTPAAGASAGASTPGSGDSSTANPSTANPSTANSSTVNSSSSPGSSSISLPPATRDTIQFQLGVKGNSTALSLYISRLPSELDEPRAEMFSDLRLISYWLASDGSRPIGLARREYKRVTADEANGTPAATIAADLVAEEVQSLQFRYFDGTEWLDTWDGTQTGSDALTPIGPPLAIEITLGIVVPSGDNSAWGQPSFKKYRHVVPILTADGVAR